MLAGASRGRGPVPHGGQGQGIVSHLGFDRRGVGVPAVGGAGLCSGKSYKILHQHHPDLELSGDLAIMRLKPFLKTQEN